MIGFIIPDQKLNRIILGKEKHENIRFYYKLAKENHMDFLLYSLKRIDFKKMRIFGFKYSFKENTLTSVETDFPKVTFIRTILRNRKTYKRLKKIERKYSVQFLNIVPERNKHKINSFLSKNEKLKPFIPDTKLLSYTSLLKFLKLYKNVIIKPINGALGERIHIIEDKSSYYLIKYTLHKKLYKKVLVKKKLYDFYSGHFVKNKTFIIQPSIPFLKYKENIFDIRVSVQKGKEALWKHTGIVSRVAEKNSFVTNVAQGGSVISFSKLKDVLNKTIEDDINTLTLTIANELEKLYPAISDLGLDISIDENNHLWFIEANYCDQRYAYHLANEGNMWLDTYRYPFEYTCTVHKNMLHAEKGKSKESS